MNLKFEEFKQRYNIKKLDPPKYQFTQQLYKKVNKLGNSNCGKHLPPQYLEHKFFHNKFDTRLLFDHVSYYRDFDGQMIIVTHPYCDFESFAKLCEELEEFLLDCGVNCKVDTYDKEYGFYGGDTVQGVITFWK
jgi:hypothetical protein